MKIVVITGQTATGKTSLGLDFVKRYNGEIVNSDSRQIYKYLDIITGKDKQTLGKTNVWLYDIVEPNEYFSSFDFVKHAVPVVKKILLAGKTPVIVGGTYLYLKHLLYGIGTDNIPPNWKLRNELNNKSVRELQEKLQTLDIQSFNRLNDSDKNNPQRLIRKIEITKNVSINQLIDTTNKSDKFKIIFDQKLDVKNLVIEFIGLKFRDKSKLRNAIKQRVEERLKTGAIKEVKNLFEMGYKEIDPGLKSIGYQQVIAYIKRKISKEKMVEMWINKEVQYAKRQLTFMKKDKNIKWRNI